MNLYLNNFQILFVVFLIIFIYFVLSSEEYERFDEKVTMTTKKNCGIACTKALGCKGFQSDDVNNICYLSESLILGAPTKSPFMKEYNKNTERCNKLNPVTDVVVASELDLKKNATYICTPNQVQNNETIKIYDNNEKIIYNTDDLPFINVDDYSFVKIDWGKEISLNNYPDLVTNKRPDHTIDIMVEHDDEYLGQYMFPHKCVENISQGNCLKQCLDNKNCAGTEWNHLYIKQLLDGKYDMYRDVCCPKIKIKQNIPRRDQFRYGHFYTKETIDRNDPALKNVTILKNNVG